MRGVFGALPEWARTSSGDGWGCSSGCGYSYGFGYSGGCGYGDGFGYGHGCGHGDGSGESSGYSCEDSEVVRFRDDEGKT
jgi:hypothetical protein